MQAIMKAAERSHFDFQARAICEREQLSPEDYPKVRASLLRAAYLEECQPFIRQLAKIEMLATPKLLVTPGGVERQGDGLTDELRAAAAEMRKILVEIERRYLALAEQ